MANIFPINPIISYLLLGVTGIVFTIVVLTNSSKNSPLINSKEIGGTLLFSTIIAVLGGYFFYVVSTLIDLLSSTSTLGHLILTITWVLTALFTGLYFAKKTSLENEATTPQRSFTLGFLFSMMGSPLLSLLLVVFAIYLRWEISELTVVKEAANFSHLDRKEHNWPESFPKAGKKTDNTQREERESSSE